MYNIFLCRKRRELRKLAGLEADEEEDRDPVLGPCKLGPGACTADPELGNVRTSYTDRIFAQCSMGCEVLLHMPCWRKFKITIDGVELSGREFKWGPMANKKDAPCFNENCQGIINYVLGPNKYVYVDKRENVSAKHPQRAAAAAAAKEQPKWAPKETKEKKGGKKHDTFALSERASTAMDELDEDRSVGTAATGEESVGAESSATAGASAVSTAGAGASGGGKEELGHPGSNGNAVERRASEAEEQQKEAVFIPLPDDALLKVRKN